MKILYSGFRWPHHSANSGYDKVSGFPGADYITDEECFWGHIKIGERWKGINLRSLDIMTKILRYKYDITHLIYTEQQLYYPYLKSKRHKVIGTIHLDIDSKFFSRILQLIGSLDAIIVLKKELIAPTHDKTGVKTVFIPHGFNKPIFQKIIPNDVKNTVINLGMINIVIIGKNYRDYNMIDSLLKNKINEKIVFHFVGQSEKTIEKFKKYKNIKIYKYINNDEYYTLISLCDYNWLPLTFATANNVLMEAQSLGIPSILPRISGIIDYAAPEQGNIFYSDIDDVLEIFNHLGKTENRKDLMTYAERFSWTEIYKQLNDLYMNLYSG
jgi:glycosyltransferase involved in cell wall biosynthesis